jgi:hypothetical protein
MSRYAKDTDVSVARSRAEIEDTVARYGAEQFVSGWRAGEAVIGFIIAGRQIRFVLPLPDKAARAFTHGRVNQSRTEQRLSDDAALKRWEQACRQRWRALALLVKAQLEAVESGITTIEDAFLAHVVLPNGETVGQWAKPQLAVAYERGTMPKLLPGPEPRH